MNTRELVDSLMVDKIVLLGPPGAGKTSIREFFFDGIPAADVLAKPARPSIGTSYKHYTSLLSHPAGPNGPEPEKLPFTVSILDTSGQEIVKWLTKEKTRIFKGTTQVWFMCDAEDWLKDEWKTTLLNLVAKINKLRIHLAPDSLLHVIMHKYDKINAGYAEIDEFKYEVRRDLQDFMFKEYQLLLDFNVLATSLHEQYHARSFTSLLDLFINSLVNIG